MAFYSEKKHSELIEETNRIGSDFLKIEAEAALTFVQVAETSTSPENRARNYANALLGYRTLLRYLPRVVLTPKEAFEIREKLEKLKVQLEQGGCCVGS